MADRKCPRCGLTFASDKLEGMCPACLLNATFDAEALSPDEGPAFWEDAPPASKKIPARTFSHFELLDELGRGGMGVVYRARDLNTERIVALKVLQAHHLEVDDLVQRFRSEVRAVSSLDHPHVLPIHEVGEHDGIPFFSMKLTTGGSLAQSLGNFLGKPRDASLLLAKVCRGVHHAHERGILHRDLKPGNILLDAAGEPYVCDFGLAKWLEDDKKLTMTAAVLGTPHYIAPEQAAGNKGLTTAVDIYSLGAILYELLTGRPPFVGGSVLETLVASQEKTPERPSSIARNVPKDLETICLKALQHDPNNRYATAKAFAEDLEAWLSGRPIQARPVGAAEQLWRWAKRNPLPATLIAALILTITAVAIGSTIVAVRIEHARKQAVAAETRATNNLFQSLLDQARASRLTGAAGQRFDSLKAVEQAAVIAPALELKQEAIGALSLYDIRPVKRISVRENALKEPLRFSPNLSLVYVATPDGDLKVVDVARGEVIHVLAGIKKPVYSLTVGGSQFVAARCEGDSLLVWDVLTRTIVFMCPDCPPQSRGPRWSYDVSFSLDGSRMAVSTETSIRIYNTTKWQEELSVPNQFKTKCIQLSRSGRSLLIANTSGPELEVWNVGAATPELSVRLRLKSIPQHAAWGQDSAIAVGCRDYNIYHFSGPNFSTERIYTGHKQDVTFVAFDKKGTVLLSTARDKTVRLWDLRSGTEQVYLSGIGAEPTLMISETNSLVGATDYGKDAIILELAGDFRSAVTLAPPVQSDYACLFSSLDYSPDGSLIALASFSGISVVDTSSFEVIAFSPFAPNYDKAIRFIHGNDTLLVTARKAARNGSTEEAPALFKLHRDQNMAKLELERRLDLQTDAMLGSHAAYDQHFLALNESSAGEVRIVDSRSLAVVQTVSVGPDVWDAAVSVAQKWLAAKYSANGPERLRIWSLESGKLIQDLQAGAAGTLTASPDLQYLITTGNAGVLRWETKTWTSTHVLPPTTENADILTAAYSADGRTIAVCRNNQVLLLDGTTFATLAVLESRTLDSHQYRLIFSPDGSHLAAQGIDNSLRIWNLLYINEQLKALGLPTIWGNLAKRNLAKK